MMDIRVTGIFRFSATLLTLDQEIYHISKAQTNTFSSGLPNFYFFIFVAFNFAQSFFKFFYPRRQHMFDVCIATSNSQVLSTYKVIF